MSRRRRQTSLRDRPSGAATSATASPPAGALAGWLSIAVSILLVARYFLPAESAPLGETLWVVQFWLMLAVVWFWLSARGGAASRRWDQLDIAIGLLIGGHLLSAGVVVCTDGDRRAALNMLWEWIGIGVATLLIREVVSNQRSRARLLSLVVISSITLAGLGVWQHHLWYPSLTAKLTEFAELRATAPDDMAESVRRDERLRQLRSELGPLVNAGDDTSSQLLRSRVAASTEPIGRFALANTFAGLLLVGLILGTGHLLREAGGGLNLWRCWGCGLLLTGTAYCFWLTKSRTAVVGLVAGLVTWALVSRHARSTSRKVRWGLVVTGGILVILPVLASLVGGLDQEVITEAPKSLQYRLEYWMATGALIREAPILGVGPGNFRQAYLRHKLPGSSEEVLDPHNLFLDVWANGGLLALAGLIWITVLLARQAWRLTSAGPGSPEADQLPQTPAESPRGAIGNCLVGVAALAMAAFVMLMNGSGYIDGIWWLLIGWCAVSLLWPAGVCVMPAVMAAAAVALFVHLMGAGGIAMPALTQTLILLAACLVSNPRVSGEQAAQQSWSALPPPLPWRPMLGAGVCLCLSVACAFTATLPVSTARTQVALGRAMLEEGGNPAAAMSVLESAIEADPLAAEPWQQLAVAHATDWQRQARHDDAAFERAVQAQREAIRLDPLAAGGWQMLGDLWWLRYQSVMDRDAVDQALAAYQHAAELYPQLASLQANLAEAAAAGGRTQIALQAARRAIALDEANRASGHQDKYLSEAARQAVDAIVAARPAGL